MNKSTKNTKKTVKNEKTTKSTRTIQKMLIKSGKTSDGKQLYEEVRIYKKMPKGWKVKQGASTQPSGYKWIHNGEPYFAKDKNGELHKNPKHKKAFIEEDWHAKMPEKEKRLWNINNPITIINSKSK